MSTDLPRCCFELDHRWPLPDSLPDLALARVRFDAAALDEQDFPRRGLSAPRGVAKRQAEHLAGRVCAHAALARLHGHGTWLARDGEGLPVWPAGLLGSLTHSHGRAAAVAGHSARWQGLGLDLERLIRPDRAERLAGEILTPGERQALAGSDPEHYAERVTLAFSLKESLFKALYPLVRQRFYFQEAAVVEYHPQGRARLRLLADLGPAWPAGRELDGHFAPDDGYLLSLVAVPAAGRARPPRRPLTATHYI